MKEKTEKIWPPVRDDMGFGELDAMRQSRGVSQTSLCHRMGINDATYSRWKRRIIIEKQNWQPRTYSLMALRHALRALIAEKVRSLEKQVEAAE